MISILIPIFNYNITTLVASIHKQLEELDIDYEIICICDASNQFLNENKLIDTYSNTQLILLKNNIGRSKIRNLLVEKSKFNWLLFLDADVLPKTNAFIKTYIYSLKKYNSKVFCGGLIYEIERPEKERMLRWVYGKKREEISAERRIKRPYQFVTGANFLINKSIFNTVKFNESIVNYGYEDVVFIEDLKLNSIEITHIDNPVFHLGIERNLVFLNKTKEGLGNLFFLNSKNTLKGDNLKILRTYRLLRRFQLNRIAALGFNVFDKLLKYNLLSSSPSIFLFDIYKLGYYCSINYSKKFKTDI